VSLPAGKGEPHILQKNDQNVEKGGALGKGARARRLAEKEKVACGIAGIRFGLSGS